MKHLTNMDSTEKAVLADAEFNSIPLDKAGSDAALVVVPPATNAASMRVHSRAGDWSDESDAVDGNETLLRLECISDQETKIVIGLMRAAVLGGLGTTIWLFVNKFTQAGGEGQGVLSRDSSALTILNMSAASVFILALLILLGVLLWKMVVQTRGRRWSSRRRRICAVLAVEVTLQLINNVFYLVPNVVAQRTPDGDNSFVTALDWTFVVRWSCWNLMFALMVVQGHFLVPWWRSGKPVNKADGLVMDAPWRMHWPKAVVWFVFQVLLILFGLWLIIPGFGNIGCSLCDLQTKAASVTFDNVSLSRFMFTISPDGIVQPNPELQAAFDLDQSLLRAQQTNASILVPYNPYVEFYKLSFVDIGQFSDEYYNYTDNYPLSDAAWEELTGIPGECNAYPGSVRARETTGEERPLECIFPRLIDMEWMLAGVLGGAAVYFVWYLYYVWLAGRELRQHPYTTYRIANLSYKLQLRLRATGFAFITVANILLGFVEFNTLNSYVLTWSGVFPSQLVMTMLIIVQGILFMPKNPRDSESLDHVSLQDFSWREVDLEPKKAARGLPTEPMFCVETTLKMMFWSRVAYHHQEVPDSPYQLAEAMTLYELDHSELIWDRVTDTKAIIAWNQETIVIAFRGTKSFRNVASDAQVWLTNVVLTESHALEWKGPGKVPRVHRGFARAFQAISGMLMEKVRQILSSHDTASHRMQHIFITGHSLGGALATLAAFDIQRECTAMCPLHIAVYTFGAPRTGNHAFAQLYSTLVPETWHIINDQDAVAKQGKFVLLYKRPGHRVILTDGGDMVVRPSVVESSIHGLALRSSIEQHRLDNYLKTLVEIIKDQLSPKMINGGYVGVTAMLRGTASASVLRRLLGLDLEALVARHKKCWPEQVLEDWGETMQLASQGILPLPKL